MENKINLSIPEDLRKKLEIKIKETNFKSIQDYILYILKQIVSEKKMEISSSREQVYTKEEEDNIKKNLEDLGYL